MSIPASDIVEVTPNVLNAGGSALDLIAILLTTSTQIPIGTAQSFGDDVSIEDYFGSGSAEAAAGTIYFNGFDNSNVKPGAVLMVQYNATAVAAYLRGGDVSGLTLAQLQALSGTMNITVDGNAFPSASVNLSAATSFSNAASIIQTALAAVQPTVSTFTGSIATTVLTVTAVASGSVTPGLIVSGGTVAGNTIITSQLTGAVGGIGTYRVTVSQTATSASLTGKGVNPTVSYDSVSGGFVIRSGNTGAISTITSATGGFANSLLLRVNLGGVLSQGANAATPGTFMDSVVALTRNWATFTTIFDPDGGSGNTLKLAFAAWTNNQSNEFAYIPWDTDVTPTQSNSAPTSLGALLKTNNYSGTMPFWGPDNTKAIMACGTAASIDFTETNGRITFKFKSQTGLTPDVTSLIIADNLRANGYDFYGEWATANQQFQGIADGTISGPFQWADTYVNQIQLNAALQLALMNLLFIVKSVPYNAAGYALMAQACADPINAGLNFGSIRSGVPLSAQQAAEVNFAAGAQIANSIARDGWYLQILSASAQVRQARGTPPAKFWYTDGESIQFINLTSIVIQ